MVLDKSDMVYAKDRPISNEDTENMRSHSSTTQQMVLDKSHMVYAKDMTISNEDHRKHEITLFHNSTNGRRQIRHGVRQR